jgi:hypothetical protein
VEFQGGERVGETKRTWPSPDKGRSMSAFTQRFTASQVGGANESDELGSPLGVEE